MRHGEMKFKNKIESICLVTESFLRIYFLKIFTNFSHNYYAT